MSITLIIQIVAFFILGLSCSYIGNISDKEFTDRSLKQGIGGSLIRVHMIMTRALKVSLESSQSLATRNANHALDHQGFIIYLKCLSSIMYSHHLSEDDVAFPYFHSFLQKAPFDSLTDEHIEMAYYMHKLDKWIKKDELSELKQKDFEEVSSYLSKIYELWVPHIMIEQDCLSPGNISSIIEQEENIRLEKEFLEYSKMHQDGLGNLVIPFMLYNLEKPEREIMALDFPWMKRNIIVPIFARKKWKPMEPFLLAS